MAGSAFEVNDKNPIAVFTLVIITASTPKVGTLVAPTWLVEISMTLAVIIAALNVKLLVDFVSG